MTVTVLADATAAEKITASVKGKSWRADRRGFCLRLPDEVDRYVRDQAKRRGMSITAIINEALAEHATVRLR